MALEAHAFEVQFQRRPSLPRAQLVAAAEKRDAKAATSDIAERLTQWHLEIARLRGLAEFRRSRNLDPSVVLAITTLAADLDAHRSLFADSLRGLPPGLASSG